MVDMQHGDLVVVLAQDEEEGVHELYEFGEVVPPEDTDNLRGKGSEDFRLTPRPLQIRAATLAPQNLVPACRSQGTFLPSKP